MYNLESLKEEVKQAILLEIGQERQILYKLFFDMRKDVTQLKSLFLDLVKEEHPPVPQSAIKIADLPPIIEPTMVDGEETLNLAVIQRACIIKALEKHKNVRKDAALDLGISERTLYRKLHELNIV